jgi:hypothetical protein
MGVIFEHRSGAYIKYVSTGAQKIAPRRPPERLLKQSLRVSAARSPEGPWLRYSRARADCLCAIPENPTAHIAGNFDNVVYSKRFNCKLGTL